MATTFARCLSQIRPTFRIIKGCVQAAQPKCSGIMFSRTFSISSALYNDKKFSKDHEWILMEDTDKGKIGITEYAQDKLGDVVFIELPEVGQTFNQGDSFGVVESVKAASDIITPVSGEVIEINSELEEKPEIVNTDPYGEGWLLKMKLSNPSELDILMTEGEYESYLQDCD